MLQYQTEALSIIDSISDKDAAQNLKKLVRFVIERNK
jgi:geranylgeranyl pyrophosphate synthase